MNDTVQTISFKDGAKLEIKADCDPGSPRDWDNMGQMVCFHARYNFGDKHDYRHEDYADWDAIQEQIEKDYNVAIILPMFMMDHSGLSICCDSSMFRACDSAGWDWGQIGFVFVTVEKLKEEYSVDEITDDILEMATKVLLGEVETYNQYVSGEVYGFVLYDTCPTCGNEGKEIDSCWGFFGSNFKENGIIDHLPKKYREEFLVEA